GNEAAWVDGSSSATWRSLRACHEERKGREGHKYHEEAASSSNLRKQRVKGDKQPKADDHAAQSIRKNVGAVPHVPLMISNVQSARWILLAILRRRIMIEKAHERTVRHVRHDTFRFVICRLKTAKDRKNDNKPETKHRETEAIQSDCCQIKGFDETGTL